MFSTAFTCLALAIYFEARDQTTQGQIAVSQVILNRAESDRFPDTVCDVILDGGETRHRCQFSFFCDGKPDTPYDAEAWRKAQWVAHITGQIGVRVKAVADAVFYHAYYVSPGWRGVDFVAQIGDHLFYRIDDGDRHGDGADAELPALQDEQPKGTDTRTDGIDVRERRVDGSSSGPSPGITVPILFPPGYETDRDSLL